ncbi:hypothetical protein BaRGS_00010225 [Batillaria attramentaria]|uniref:NEDD8 ultimate buster 1 n=1 Tax=Batillaria attramentaria TaxID=370345 RepID=A0ABD0LGT1_9CAEN
MIKILTVSSEFERRFQVKNARIVPRVLVSCGQTRTDSGTSGRSATMEGYNQELVLSKIREKLNADKVKLWLPPYTTEEQERGEVPLEIIKRYACELAMKEDDVAKSLEHLRLHALEKLAERKKFQATGIASLKVKLAAGQGSAKRVISIEINLDKTGADLKQMIAEVTKNERTRLKLICAGRVLNDGDCLRAQNIRNGSQVMVVVLSATEAEVIQHEHNVSAVSRTREAAELLSARAGEDDDTFDVQIADQKGRPLALPKEEKREKKYSRALLLLLEADKEFGNCRAEILDHVDNYAILSLDIVWCYLCLENVNELPDAERRLHKCEDMFRKSYGDNMERLMSIKGGAEAERILLMRLHLLQGIVKFHQHNTTAAQYLLNQAMDEYTTLQVDPDALAQLMGIGFAPREARLGLRACQGNVDRAAEYVMKERQEKAEIKEKVKKDREDRRLAKKYGNCANGEGLNMQNVSMLVDMSFPRAAAAEALKQTNNDVALALELLQTHPELLDTPDVGDKEPVQLQDTDIAQLVALGFEPEMVKVALRKHRNNTTRAVDDLIKYGGVLPYASDDSLSDNSASSSSGSESPEKVAEKKKRERENEMLDELVSDITRDENDHLDVEMTEERQFLDDYLARLKSLS